MAGARVEHDIVDLGVVVGDADRDFAPFHQVGQDVADRRVRQHEIDLGLGVLRAVGHIGLEDLVESFETSGRVMEAGNRLVQRRPGQVDQQALEPAEHPRRLAGQCRRLERVVGDCVLDEVVHSPDIAVGVTVVRAAVSRGDDFQLPRDKGDILLFPRTASRRWPTGEKSNGRFSRHFRLDVLGDADDVRHHLHGIL